jgi:hypothetical protein
MHIVGSPGLFTFEVKEGYDPGHSIRLAKSIPVGKIPNSISPASVRSVVSTTPVKNELGDMSWNCQHWVAEALSRLVTYGYLETSQREEAVNTMTDVILEAEDEEE